MDTFERNPNAVQFGGDHYHRAGYHQHWDLLAMLGYGWEYYTGRASAYLTRVKDPELDPSKAGHFLDKLVWLIDTGHFPATFQPTGTPSIDLDNFLRDSYFPANGIVPTSLEAKAIKAILSARNREHLRAARDLCSQLEAGVSSSDRDMFNNGGTLKHDPNHTSEGGWPFTPVATGSYVDQDTPPPVGLVPIVSGGGGDFGGGGAEGDYKPDTPQAEADNRSFVYGDSAIAATAERPVDESCRREDYAPSPAPSPSYEAPAPSPSYSSSPSYDSSSSSSSDSGSSSGGGGGSD